MRKRRREREAGSAMVEFVLCFALIWMPLFSGLFYTGFNLVREIQATQFCRDAGHLYSYGTDFSQTAQQTLLKSLAPGFDFTSSTGTALVLLSTITYVSGTDCTANSLQADTQHCPNMNQVVITRRIAIGNTTLSSSNFATPSASIVDSAGNITPANYLTDASARAPNFTGLIPLQSGQFAFLSEVWVQPWFPNGSSVGASARSIF